MLLAYYLIFCQILIAFVQEVSEKKTETLEVYSCICELIATMYL